MPPMATRSDHPVWRRLGSLALRFIGPTWPLAPIPPVIPPALPDCPRCGGQWLCPVEWAAEDAGHWHVVFRCGGCQTRLALVIDNRQAAALDVELDRQLESIRAAAERLDAERMATEAHAYAAALHAGLIVAADFV